MAGTALRWSAWESRRKLGQATLAVGHDGKFNRAEFKIDQSLYCALPSKSNMRPAMVFTFEVFLLRGDLSPFDRVVAWGAYPICNEHFDIVQGKCKLPLLRGPMRQNIDRFQIIQHLISRDLDNWLGNLYIDIKLLPKFTLGQTEIRVQTKFKKSTLSLLDKVRQMNRKPKYEVMENEEENDSEEEDQIIPTDWWKSDEKDYFVSPLVGTMKNTTIATPFVPSELRNQQQKGITEVYSRRHNFDPDQAYEDQATDLLMSHEDRLGHNVYESWQNNPKSLSYADALEEHHFPIRRSETNLGRHVNPVFERAKFTARMFLGELGLLYWNSVEFWWTWVILIVFWFVQYSLHYLGQYLYLLTLNVIPSVFVFYPYTFDMIYQQDSLNMGETTVLVLMGPLSDIIMSSLTLIKNSFFSRISFIWKI